MVRRLLFLFLIIASPICLSAQTDAVFKDDLTQHVMTGEKQSTRDVAIDLTAEALVVTPKNGQPFTIPYRAISAMTYDRRSKVRKMAYTMGPATKHYLTVQYRLDAGGDVLEVEMGKNVAPTLVAQLEAKSGQRIERTGS